MERYRVYSCRQPRAYTSAEDAGGESGLSFHILSSLPWMRMVNLALFFLGKFPFFFPFRHISWQSKCPTVVTSPFTHCPWIRGQRTHLGSKWCPFVTVVFLRSSYVLWAASPKKQSCLNYLTLVSWWNALGWEISCPALPHSPPFQNFLCKLGLQFVDTTFCQLCRKAGGSRTKMNLASLEGLSCQRARV